MTVSIEDEVKLVDHIIADPEAHYMHTDSNKRDDGIIIVSRDGLRVRLHRRLYREVFGGLGTHEFLVKTCGVFGCLNPYHYDVTRTPRPSHSRCRNGHEYTEEDVRDDGSHACQKCRRERIARRPRRGGEPRFEQERRIMFCPHGHGYTPENTYRWTDKLGHVHRKCKACTIIRARGGNPAEVVRD